MIRKNIYKWHRTTSMIIAIPVLLWAISGFLHPIMTNIRPKIATQFIKPAVIDSSTIKMPLQEALQKNGIDSFLSVRLIAIDTNWFYQVKLLHSPELEYYSVSNGKKLNKGDWLYAQYLARIFLEGQKKDSIPPSNRIMNTNLQSDCCDAASNCVLKPKKGAPVKDISLLTSFDAEYKSINRLLPVYKVSFERPDAIRIYVETGQDRFSVAIDRNRAWFSTFFSLVHTMEWLNMLGKARLLVEMAFAALAFGTAIMGIYIFLITKSKKPGKNQLLRARRNHRYTAIIFSFFTLMFSFSGCFHAFSKLKEDTRDQYFIEHPFASASIQQDMVKIRQIVKKQITNISLVYLDNQSYWQIKVKEGTKTNKKEITPKDLMKEMSATAPTVVYINTKDYTMLPEGEKKYAQYLATQFSKQDVSTILSTELITKLEGEYGFANKRLPVWKISYPVNHQERYYVETSSGKLSVRIDNTDLWEANSFNYLHKHHFMDFAGKSWRDFSTMFWVASQIAMIVIGLILYARSQFKKPKNA